MSGSPARLGHAPVDQGQPVVLEREVHRGQVAVNHGQRPRSRGPRTSGAGVVGQGQHALAQRAGNHRRPEVPAVQRGVDQLEAGVRRYPAGLEEADECVRAV